jgi:hypothetical protein
MQDRADKNNRDREDELAERFTLEFTREEGMLLLTSARLLDKLVAGVTIHARERDQLIKDIIEKLAGASSPEVAKVSCELADAIVDSVLGDELEDDYSYVSDALAINMSDADSFLDSYTEEDLQALRRSIAEDARAQDLGELVESAHLNSTEQFDIFARELDLELDDDDAQVDFPMYATDETLPVLEKAMINHNSVRAHYYSFARESVDTLTLNPLVIIKEQNNWRMVAYCMEKGQILLFRVDRIKEISETTDSFEAPRDVNQISYKRLPVYS